MSRPHSWQSDYCTKDWRPVRILSVGYYFHARGILTRQPAVRIYLPQGGPPSQAQYVSPLGSDQPKKHLATVPWSPLRLARIQCKDIPTRPILEYLGGLKPYVSAGWLDLGPTAGPSVRDAMPRPIPDNLVIAKMRNLLKRNLVDGCGCGCHGDFTLTEKGRAVLLAEQAAI